VRFTVLRKGYARTNISWEIRCCLKEPLTCFPPLDCWNKAWGPVSPPVVTVVLVRICHYFCL